MKPVATLSLAFCFSVAAHADDVRAETTTCLPTSPTTKGAVIAPLSAVPLLRVSPDIRSKYFVSARDALKASAHPLLVDARVDSERAQFWLPGAVRVSSDFLITSTLIRSADSVVLIGDGKDDARLLAAARKLPRSKAQSVRIVSGGVVAWYRAGGEVAGDVAALEAPVIIDEKEFYELVTQGALVASTTKLATDRRLLREIVAITNTPTDTKNIATLRQHAGTSQSLVLILPDGDMATQWARIVSEAFDQAPFIFLDSGNRYADFLEQQRQIIASAGKPLVHRCDVR